MRICHCKNVSDQKIAALVAGGASTVGQIGRASGAGTSCGGCVPAIVEVLEQTLPAQTTLQAQLVTRQLPLVERMPAVERPLAAE